MDDYVYRQLSYGSIRLLQLLPRKDGSNPVQCKIFEYPLRNLDNPSHLYEALSYVWGSELKPCSIIVDDNNQNLSLSVTQNLHGLLLRLQDQYFPRIIWADAICIDQENEKEKEHQISYMAEIYSKATRVIVWLGEAADESDKSLEAIRLAGEMSTKSLPRTCSDKQPILKLLQRQWFQRIWVLQEVAAARHILMICGSAEIDGHAFSLGLDSFGTASDALMIQVTFLMRAAIFRPREPPRNRDRLSLDIGFLGELVDMYHPYKATKVHDKIYALLGMCSDNLQKAGLEPNYDLEWEELMQRLVKCILGDQVFVQAWNDKEVAVIKSPGYVLGTVSKVKRSVSLAGNVQKIEINFSNTPRKGGESVFDWTLRSSAKSVRKGDLVCLLRGAARPSIARLCKDHFEVILIAVVFPDHMGLTPRDVTWSELLQSAAPVRDFLLVWDWDIGSGRFKDCFNIWMLTKNLRSENLETTLKGHLDHSIESCRVVLILGDAGEWEKAEEALHEGIGDNSEDEQPYSQKEEVIKLILEASRTEGSWKNKSSHRLLLYAAVKGHLIVANFLLHSAKIDVESKDDDGETPLWHAVMGGNEAMVTLLLEANADTESKKKGDQTPLFRAIIRRNEAMVKLLLEANADIEAKDGGGHTPLHHAVFNEAEAMVKLLLEANADINSKNGKGQTPRHWAVMGGNEAIVKLLQSTTTTSSHPAPPPHPPPHHTTSVI